MRCDEAQKEPTQWAHMVAPCSKVSNTRLRDRAAAAGRGPPQESHEMSLFTDKFLGVQKQKCAQEAHFSKELGGESGIRTRGGLLTPTRFPGVRLKPLIHLSGARNSNPNIESVETCGLPI